MIRILHFVSIPATWSGVMHVIMNYYRHLERSEIQFDFLCFHPCSKEESYETEIQKLGGHVTYIEKPGSSLNSICQLTTFFKRHAKEYDWLHNHEIYLSFLLKPLASHYGLKHFIVHCHATQYSDRSIAAFRNQILCLPIQFMNCKRFACSYDAGYFLYGKRQMELGHVFIMQNAIELETYQFNQEKRDKLRRIYQLENSFVIGHVGRMEQQKNHMFLLKVFQLFYQRYPESKLLLIGDGSLKEALKKKAMEYGIQDSVIFLGARNDVPDLLQVMDIFLLPSLFEGVGISLLEAQANGLSCIASDRVPREVSINNQVEFIEISNSNQIETNQGEKSLKKWFAAIERKRHVERDSSMIDKMLHSPYNIDVAVDALAKQYTNI